MKKLFLSLLLAVAVVGLAQAASVSYLVIVNTYVNTTEEQLSSNTGLATCSWARVCNRSTSNKARINTTSTVSTSASVLLWPDSATATEQNNCWTPPIPEGFTFDATSVYVEAVTGTVTASVECARSK